MRNRVSGRQDCGPAHVPLLVRSTSPAHFLAALLLGACLQHLLDLPLPQGRALAWIQIAGGIGAGAGLLLALACFVLFAQLRTTILPERAPSGLVLRGPYRYSRNPMYVSLVLSYAGLCVQIGWPWALLLLPLPLLALQRVVIPFEEARLRERFGSAYDRYCAQVRRWL
ncbi:isoprenylcysteine carboxylmethyltransferase family protein [Xanthomonas campestris pv. phormiicola]|nr:isoprenylcysteine carboxylmethyltransferase family protein [Xanthomonas campestris pv. phormiicola]UYC17327.1 isoprenylcysteine carboxylmethyltransferase family protein [Xanthomonas campestris pv. phormiicola]